MIAFLHWVLIVSITYCHIPINKLSNLLNRRQPSHASESIPFERGPYYSHSQLAWTLLLHNTDTPSESDQFLLQTQNSNSDEHLKERYIKEWHYTLVCIRLYSAKDSLHRECTNHISYKFSLQCIGMIFWQAQARLAYYYIYLHPSPNFLCTSK